MRIGIDARCVSYPKTGDRTYTLGLLSGLVEVNAALGAPHEFILYFDRPPPDDLPCRRGGRLLPAWHTRVLRTRVGRLWTLRALPRAAREDALDVLHVQYNAPRLRRPAIVTTVHDVSFRLFPEWFSLKDRLLLDWGLRGTLRVARAVLAVSECTARDLQRIYGVPPERIAVTPNAAPVGFARADEPEVRQVLGELQVPEPYALFVGVLQPRKNVIGIVRAFLRARREHSLPHNLVIAGKVGWKAEEILETVRAAELTGAVRYLGYVEDRHLPALYTGAQMLVFPTFYEGFGIPVLEAFACGTAVIGGTEGAVPEVAGDAALLVDPYDEQALAAAIARLALDTELRATLIERGRARLGDFSWRRTAELTLQAYQRAVPL